MVSAVVRELTHKVLPSRSSIRHPTALFAGTECDVLSRPSSATAQLGYPISSHGQHCSMTSDEFAALADFSIDA
jgi:hypothetical protein